MLVSPANPDFARRAARVRLLGIDFDGVMTDNMVYLFEDGREAVRCSRLEGYGLRRVAATGVHCFILSTEENQVVTRRANKLNIECIQNCADKVEAFLMMLSKHDVSMMEASFIGNDVNDLELLKMVGLPAIVADAHEDLNILNAFRTRHKGGNGAVRELCDAIAMVREGTS
jgi:3-deoxy-D-manno-octulosonate 8-phosphate phosphatase (KDO 8-P phosphatase)